VLWAERMSEAQLVEARAQAEREQIEALAALAQNASARLYVGFDKHAGDRDD